MSEGNKTFLGGGVPTSGESEIIQKDILLDILTITGAPGQSGDFLVLQNSSGTERFVIDKNGNFDASNLTITGTFGVTGTTGLTGAVTVTGALTQSTGAVTIKGATAVSGALTLTNTLYIGNTTTAQKTQMFGALNQSFGAVSVKGATTFAGTVHNTGAVTMAGALTMSGGAGDIVLKKNATHSAVTPFARLNLAMLHTVPTSAAGCATGDLFMFHVTTDVWRMALCTSGLATTFARARRAEFDVTLGSAS